MKGYVWLLWWFSVLALAGGCRLFDAAWRTTVSEPLHFSRHAYEKISRKHFLEVAQQSLEQAMADARAHSDQYDCVPFSEDYQAGFLDGYVDYLEAGGDGNVPPTPPRHYWKSRYQNPAGFTQMEEWVRGFQHGTRAAQASNYRDYVVLPLADSVTMDTTPYPYGRLRADAPAELPNAAPLEAGSRESDRYAGQRRLDTIEAARSFRVTQLPEVIAEEDHLNDHIR